MVSPQETACRPIASPNWARSAPTEGETGAVIWWLSGGPRPVGDHARGAAVAAPREAPRVSPSASRRAGLVNGIAERLGELVHALRRQEEARRSHQLLVTKRVVGDAL